MGPLLIRFFVQIALYVFPLLWAALLVVSLLKLGFASVRSAAHHLTSTDRPFQLHSYRRSCFGVQRDKRYRFHIRVGLSYFLKIFSNINTRVATEMRNKNGQMAL